MADKNNSTTSVHQHESNPSYQSVPVIQDDLLSAPPEQGFRRCPRFQQNDASASSNPSTRVNEQTTQSAPMASSNSASSDISALLQQIIIKQNQLEERLTPTNPSAPSCDATPPPSNNRDPSPTQDNSLISDIKDAVSLVQDDVKALLPDKCRVTLSLDNCDAWSSAIHREASILGAVSTLEQPHPPVGSSPIDEAMWKRKATVMRARMLNAMTAATSDKFGPAYDLSAHEVWSQATTLFGKSTGEERIRFVTELKQLYLQDNDHLQYQTTFNRITNRLATIGQASYKRLLKANWTMFSLLVVVQCTTSIWQPFKHSCQHVKGL